MKKVNQWPQVLKKIVLEFLFLNFLINGLYFIAVNRNLEKIFTLDILLKDYFSCMVALGFACAYGGFSSLKKNLETGRLQPVMAKRDHWFTKVSRFWLKHKLVLTLSLILLNSILFIPLVILLGQALRWLPATYYQALILKVILCSLAGTFIGAIIIPIYLWGSVVSKENLSSESE